MDPWRRGLDESAGQAGGLTQRYIAHLLKLACLTPGVMQAINAGTFPAHLTLARMRKYLPLD
jgi:hypothetical protein